MIVGGGTIAYYLAKAVWQDMKIRVTNHRTEQGTLRTFKTDPARSDALILNGDGTDQAASSDAGRASDMQSHLVSLDKYG